MICPTGCGRSVALGNLLCRPCWHVVPPELAADVWRTWRAWNKDIGSLEARKAYLTSAAAATAAAKERATQARLFG